MRIAVHRLGQHLDVIEPGHRYALEKIFDVPVSALPRIGVRLLVQAEVTEIEGGLVRTLQLLVLDEMPLEVPGLRLQRRPTQTGFDQTVGGLEILIQQEARRDERLSDRVDALARLLLRKIRGEAKGVDPPAEQRCERIFILPVREPTHQGLRGGARDLAARRRNTLTEDADDGEALVVARLRFLLGRHFPKGELIDDILGGNQFRLGGERQLEQLQVTVALLNDRVVALQAVLVEEGKDIRMRTRLRAAGNHREQQKDRPRGSS